MVRLWLAARAAGVEMGLASFLGMRVRGSPIHTIVEASIMGHVAGVKWPVELLESHALAGGDPGIPMKAAIVLQKGKLAVDRDLLLAAALKHIPVVEIAKTYADCHKRLPNGNFNELLVRALQGEDVLATIASGSLVPRSGQSGWRARLEFGPLTAQELKELLAAYTLPPATSVWDP